MTSGGTNHTRIDMNRRPIIPGLVGILIMLMVIPVFAAPVVIDAADQFQFARELMDRGEYAHAILEFERFIHFFPEHKDISKVRSLIGLCYMKAGRYEKARAVFQEIIKTHHDDIFAQKALFLIGESYYEEGVTDEAEFYFQRLFREFPESSLRQAALYRLGWTKMKENQWEDASHIFGQIRDSGPYYMSANELAAASLKGKSLPQKSPKLAGTLAAILPGLGHAYVGRYRDGSVAFLVNALFLGAAMESFHNGDNVLGGMLCFLELGWYSGNIYSAVNVAHKYNRRIRNDFRKGLKDRLELNPLVTSHGGAGLSISFRF